MLLLLVRLSVWLHVLFVCGWGPLAYQTVNVSSYKNAESCKIVRILWNVAIDGSHRTRIGKTCNNGIKHSLVYQITSQNTQNTSTTNKNNITHQNTQHIHKTAKQTHNTSHKSKLNNGATQQPHQKDTRKHQDIKHNKKTRTTPNNKTQHAITGSCLLPYGVSVWSKEFHIATAATSQTSRRRCPAGSYDPLDSAR